MRRIRAVGDVLQKRRDGAGIAQNAAAAKLVAGFVVALGQVVLQLDRLLVSERRQKVKKEKMRDFAVVLVGKNPLLDQIVNFLVAPQINLGQFFNSANFDFPNFRSNHRGQNEQRHDK